MSGAWMIPVLLLFLTAPVAATGEEGDARLIQDPSDKTPTRDFDLEVNRLWTESGQSFAKVEIRNVSDQTLAEVVVRCQAFGANSKNLDFHEERIEGTEDAMIEPGFMRELRIPFDTGGQDVESVTCNARGW